MGGINYCQGIPAVVTHQNFGRPMLDIISGPAGKICAVAKNIQDQIYGRKWCNGYQTPPLTWVPLTIRAKNLEEFSYDLDLWVGFEDTPDGTCFWAGVDGGPGTEMCVRTPECYAAEVPYEAIVSLIEDLLNQLHEAVDKDSVIDTILKAVFAIVLAVGVLAAAAILSVGPGIVIAGLGIAGLVGASAG